MFRHLARVLPVAHRAVRRSAATASTSITTGSMLRVPTIGPVSPYAPLLPTMGGATRGLSTAAQPFLGGLPSVSLPLVSKGSGQFTGEDWVIFVRNPATSRILQEEVMNSACGTVTSMIIRMESTAQHNLPELDNYCVQIIQKHQGKEIKSKPMTVSDFLKAFRIRNGSR